MLPCASPIHRTRSKLYVIPEESCSVPLVYSCCKPHTPPANIPKSKISSAEKHFVSPLSPWRGGVVRTDRIGAIVRGWTKRDSDRVHMVEASRRAWDELTFPQWWQWCLLFVSNLNLASHSMHQATLDFLTYSGSWIPSLIAYVGCESQTSKKKHSISANSYQKNDIAMIEDEFFFACHPKMGGSVFSEESLGQVEFKEEGPRRDQPNYRVFAQSFWSVFSELCVCDCLWGAVPRGVRKRPCQREFRYFMYSRFRGWSWDPFVAHNGRVFEIDVSKSV